MGVLSNVIKARELSQNQLKVLVHGNSGTGKSSLCGTAKGKVLYLPTEKQGIISFKRVCPEGDVLEVTSLSILRGVLEELRGTQHDYDSVCIDSLTEAQRMIIDEVIAKTPGRESPSIEDWRLIIERTAGLVRAYRDLNMNVVITTLSEEFVSEDSRIVRPALSGKRLPAQIAQYFNIVGYAFKVVGKKGAGAEVKYKILIEGKDDFTCKGLPGLRYVEDPDITYWYDRVFNDCESIDPTARHITQPKRVSYKKVS